MSAPSLAVLVDGVELPEAEARALWQRFSAWMEEHEGDLLGFARAEGYASVHPGMANGRPVLVASRTAAQKPYAPVREAPPSPGSRAGRASGSSPKQDGGSGSRQHGPSGRPSDRGKSRRKSR